MASTLACVLCACALQARCAMRIYNMAHCQNWVVYSELYGKTDYWYTGFLVLTLQSVVTSWNFQPTMPTRRQHGLIQFSSLVKVLRFGITQKRVVWPHHHLGWRDSLGRYQNGHIQSQVLLEAILLGHHQIQLHQRDLLVLLECTHR